MKEKINIPLSNFQQWMQQMLLDPYQQTEVDPGSLLPDSSHASLEDVIHHSQKLSAREHLGIYQRSYIARLRNCMSQQFSALEYALGEDIFCAFADDYLASRPSTHYNLALLGNQFPQYLELNRPDAHEELKEDWIDFMIELARFEYDLGVIFEMKSEEDYTLATNETREEDLKIVPTCALFHFRFPIRKFYSNFKNKKQPDLPFEKESYCVVLRHNFKLAVYDLHKKQFEFLQLLKQGLDVPLAKIRFKELNQSATTEFDDTWNKWKERWVKAKFFQVKDDNRPNESESHFR
ncbi:MAG: DNA-binding domain-containing protein [Bacteroidota bacterium]